MVDDNNLFINIKNNMHNFSKGQKKLATFILNNYEKAVFLTASKLGQLTGVSESTVVRFVNEIGFDGYAKFQSELQTFVRAKINSVQRMCVSVEQIAKSNKDVLTTVLERDAEKIKDTINEIDTQVFDSVVSKILSAKKVYIVGVRSSSCLSSFLFFYLNLMLDNVIYFDSSTGIETFEQIFRIDKDDLLIAISFPRYSKRTIKALEYAFNKNVTTVAITDSYSSPLVKFATNSLIARSDMISFMDSLVAPLSLINALLVAISIKTKDEVINRLESLEAIWQEYEVYNYTSVYF